MGFRPHTTGGYKLLILVVYILRLFLPSSLRRSNLTAATLRFLFINLDYHVREIVYDVREIPNLSAFLSYNITSFHFIILHFHHATACTTIFIPLISFVRQCILIIGCIITQGGYSFLHSPHFPYHLSSRIGGRK